MESRIMTVYYGVDRLPYKDVDRSIHYPIATPQSGGGVLTGENNTTKIGFYVDRIGNASFSWVAVIKKPNGNLLYRLLDAPNSDGCVYLDLADLYTDLQGAIFVSLQGYYGEIDIEEEDGEYTINGEPNILLTGSIKIMVNYTPMIYGIGSSIEHTEMQEVLAKLGDYGLTTSNVAYYNNINSIKANEIPKNKLKDDQLVYNNNDGYFYRYDANDDTFIRQSLPIKYKDLNLTSNLPSAGSGLYFGNVYLPDGVSSYYALYYQDFGGNNVLVINADLTIRKYVFIDNVYSLSYEYATKDSSGVIRATDFKKVSGNTESSVPSVSELGIAFNGNHSVIHEKVEMFEEAPLVDSEDGTAYVSIVGNDQTVKSIDLYCSDASAYKYKIKYTMADGTIKYSATEIDLPIEEVIVSGYYDSQNKNIVLSLRNGNVINVPVGDLVEGIEDKLEEEIEDVANNLEKVLKVINVSGDTSNPTISNDDWQYFNTVPQHKLVLNFQDHEYKYVKDGPNFPTYACFVDSEEYILRVIVPNYSLTYSHNSYYKESEVDTLLNNKQDTINASNKLSPSYIDLDTTHRFVTDAQISKWNKNVKSIMINKNAPLTITSATDFTTNYIYYVDRNNVETQITSYSQFQNLFGLNVTPQCVNALFDSEVTDIASTLSAVSYSYVIAYSSYDLKYRFYILRSATLNEYFDSSAIGLIILENAIDRLIEYSNTYSIVKCLATDGVSSVSWDNITDKPDIIPIVDWSAVYSQTILELWATYSTKPFVIIPPSTYATFDYTYYCAIRKDTNNTYKVELESSVGAYSYIGSGLSGSDTLSSVLILANLVNYMTDSDLTATSTEINDIWGN